MDFEVLLQQPESLRDGSWEEDFFKRFSQMKVQLDSDQARKGPDGWPYLFARTGSEGTEPVPHLVQWLAGRGIGLVINSHKMLPDYVFPYGMLWHYVETSSFLQPGVTPRQGEVVYKPDSGLLMGPPTEKYLPTYVRAVLREFLNAQGFAAPRILVISTADFKEVDLVFSIESLGRLALSQHKTMAAMLAWFLPLHYTLVLGSEDGLQGFVNL